MDAFPNHDTVWLQEWRQSVSFPLPRLSCPTIWVKWRFFHIRPEGHPGKFYRNVLTADGDYKNEVGVCCQTHSSNIDAMNTLQLDWSDVSLPAHCWTNAVVGSNWKKWKYQWLKKKTLKWLGSYHSINMASLVSESWFCKLLCSIFILGHLKKHGLTLDNFV